MDNFEQMIPALRGWNGDIDCWIRAIGRFDHAVAYGQLFWPEFKIHKECVLFASCTGASFDQWMQQTGGDRRAVERVLNHRHIVDIFMQSEFAATRDIVLCLGRLLRDIWSCKLARDFPAMPIVVSFNEDFGDDLVDAQITFFRKV